MCDSVRVQVGADPRLVLFTEEDKAMAQLFYSLCCHSGASDTKLGVHPMRSLPPPPPQAAIILCNCIIYCPLSHHSQRGISHSFNRRH